MTNNDVLLRALFAIATFALTLTGCDDGSDGERGPAGPRGAGAATELAMTISKVTVASAPVVEFRVTDQDGFGVDRLSTDDLRFTIAKLVPGSPSPNWQSYIVTTATSSANGAPGNGRTAVQATRENNGTLVDRGDGEYRYTFATDVANVTCPAPCVDAFGNALDLSFDAQLTHRVGIQTRGDLPPVNAVYTFRPSDGATTGLASREIVKTARCNNCHDRLEAHDARIEVKYCVTCHNPGSVDPDSIDPAKDNSPGLAHSAVRSSGAVDFKIMIHKIHRGEFLPSVERGPDFVEGNGDDGTGEYAIWGYRNTKHDFSDIVFPQDIRNCSTCHGDSDPETPQGGNWESAPSIEACGSCHDHIKFGVQGRNEFNPSADVDGHPGGVMTDNSTCVNCHTNGIIAGSVASDHQVPEKVAAANFQFNILSICGIAVVDGRADTDGEAACQPGGSPTVTFSVTDPTGAANHLHGNAYGIRSADGDPEFRSPAASLNVLASWNTVDYTNAGGSGSRPSRANSVNVRNSGSVVFSGNGTYTVTMPALPDGTVTAANPAGISASGTGVVAIEGHPAGAGVDGVFQTANPSDDVRATVKAVVAYFGIDDGEPVPRREVVDIVAKCDRCHDVLSLHGNNRSDEAQLCVMCHNPSGTDYARRPRDGDGLPTGGSDGKPEESIDFRRLIHAVHAAASSNSDGTLTHGFREKGIVVYGFRGSIHDYSEVRFPGDLTKCETCHEPDTYKLMDRTAEGGANWAEPAQNGIQGSTVNSVPPGLTDPDPGNPPTLAELVTASVADPTDDLKISPTAAVCSSCHDGTLAEEHMKLNGALFGVTQAAIEANVETCAVCHGPGKIASVELVHSSGFGEDIP